MRLDANGQLGAHLAAMAPGDAEARVAIIAGAGRFPFHVAREAKRRGGRVVALGIRGWADPALAEQVDVYEEVAVGEIGTLLARLKSHGMTRVVMAGKVTKAVLLTQSATFDAEARRLLGQRSDLSVNSLLGGLARRLADEGITLVDSSVLLSDSVCPAGVLAARKPTAAESEDLRIGAQAARQVASLDIGQTVVVKERVVIAVEALEGTDAAVRRAQALAGGGLVVVKMASPTQDRRFDLPVIGTDTIATLRECGVSCLGVEAGMTLLLDRAALLDSANQAGLCIVGLTASPTAS